MDGSTAAEIPFVEAHGLRVADLPGVLSPRMRRVIERGRYEPGEVALAERLLGAGDVLLELGAGIGLVSTVAARRLGPENVIAVEANPDLIPAIRATHALNGVAGVTLCHGVAGAGPGAPVAFHVAPDFWASSMAPGRHRRRVEVPAVDCGALIAARRPTVLMADIEGGELELLADLPLGGFRKIALELHPRVYGAAGVERLFRILGAKGFAYDAALSPGGSVVVLTPVA